MLASLSISGSKQSSCQHLKPELSAIANFRLSQTEDSVVGAVGEERVVIFLDLAAMGQ